MRHPSADAQSLLDCPIAGLTERVRALQGGDSEPADSAVTSALAHLLGQPDTAEHKGLRFELLLSAVCPSVDGVRRVPIAVARTLLTRIDLRGPWSYVAVSLACLVDSEDFAADYLQANLRLFGTADADIARGMIAWRPTLQEKLRARGMDV